MPNRGRLAAGVAQGACRFALRDQFVPAGLVDVAVDELSELAVGKLTLLGHEGQHLVADRLGSVTPQRIEFDAARGGPAVPDVAARGIFRHSLTGEGSCDGTGVQGGHDARTRSIARAADA